MWKFLLSHWARAVILPRSLVRLSSIRCVPFRSISLWIDVCVCVCILCSADCNYVSKAIDRQFHGNTNSLLEFIFPFGLYLSPSFRLVHPIPNLIVSVFFFYSVLAYFKCTRAPDELHLLPFKLFRIAINSLNMNFNYQTTGAQKKSDSCFYQSSSASPLSLFLLHRICLHRF